MLAPVAQLCGVALVVFIPAACTGASIPAFGRIGDQYGISVALLYGLNTLGATLAVVFTTGFVTFLLEVAWFRALSATFETTTTGFAIMLSVVLLALGMAARKQLLVTSRFMRWTDDEARSI